MRYYFSTLVIPVPACRDGSVARDLRYHEFAGRLAGLYKEITDKALRNEQARK
jgi:hypothetical protein